MLKTPLLTLDLTMLLGSVSRVTSHDQLASTIQRLCARLDYTSVDGHRTKPDRKDLVWNQIGVLGTLENKRLPLFTEWLSLDRPPTNGKANVKIVKVQIVGDESRIEERFGSEPCAAIGLGVKSEWVAAAASNGELEMVAVHVVTPSDIVKLD